MKKLQYGYAAEKQTVLQILAPVLEKIGEPAAGILIGLVAHDEQISKELAKTRELLRRVYNVIEMSHLTGSCKEPVKFPPRLGTHIFNYLQSKDPVFRGTVVKRQKRWRRHRRLGISRNVDWLVFYVAPGTESEVYRSFENFKMLKAAKAFLGSNAGYILKRYLDPEGPTYILVGYFGEYVPTATEAQKIKQLTGRPLEVRKL